MASLMHPTNAFKETREIQNVLSGKRFTLCKNWTIILGVAGALDFIFYCLVELDTAMKDNLNNDDFRGNTKGRRGIGWSSPSLSWKQEEPAVQLPTSILTGIFLHLHAPRMDTLFCIMWVFEAFRRAYLCALSAEGDHSENKKKRQKTFVKFIGILSIFIFFLPSSYWYPIDSPSPSAEYYRSLVLPYLKRFSARLGKRLTFFAIRHPKHFKQRMAVVLSGVRWLRYYIPIILSANKFVCNLRKFLVTYGQHKAANITRKIKIILWHKPRPTDIDERAALCLQRNYRRWKAMHRAKAMILFRKDEKAAADLQRIFRRHLERARARIRARTKELHELRKSKTLRNHQSEQDDKREKELESDLTRVLQRKRDTMILVRPNCLFSTVWKAVVMAFVGIAIVTQYYKAILTKSVDERTGIPYTMESYLIQRLLPTPISDVCHTIQTPQTVARRFLGSFLNLHRARPLSDHITTIPWYCKEVVIHVQALYLNLGTFIINRAIVSVGAILLLDVFVTFFTGEFDSSGTLVPTPFIKRWILGFAVKLLLNPLSKPVATAALGFVIEAGPTRIYRWHLAFCKPVLQFFWWDVWMRFVQSSSSNRKS